VEGLLDVCAGRDGTAGPGAALGLSAEDALPYFESDSPGSTTPLVPDARAARAA